MLSHIIWLSFSWDLPLYTQTALPVTHCIAEHDFCVSGSVVSLLCSYFLKINKRAAHLLEVKSLMSHIRLPPSPLEMAGSHVFFFLGRSNQNHPGASGHRDHCGREHCVTLPGHQRSRPWCFFLLGLQWTAHRQGRWSLWICGWGEWATAVVFLFFLMCEWALGTSPHLASLHPCH